MFGFHGHTTAPITGILHGSQLVFANMLCIDFRRTAETAFGFFSTGIAEMPGLICHRATIFTCICHNLLLSGYVKPKK